MFGSNIRTSQTRVCSPIVSYRIRLHELAWKKIDIMLLANAEWLRKALILNTHFRMSHLVIFQPFPVIVTTEELLVLFGFVTKNVNGIVSTQKVVLYDFFHQISHYDNACKILIETSTNYQQFLNGINKVVTL